MERVWLHGAGLSPAFWSKQATGARLALPVQDVTTVETMAGALLPDCPAQFDLIGHSLGGMVAMIMAAQEPDRVRRLVLVETIAHMGEMPTDLAPPSADTLPPWLRVMDGITNEAAAAGLRAAIAFDGRVVAARILAPTLIIHAADNPVTQEGSRALAALIPAARRIELPGNHYLPSDCPQPFHDAVNAFLGDVS